MKAIVCVLALAACSDYRVCSSIDTRTGSLPRALSATGLDGPDTIAVEPRFELWIDGAVKRRWIRLPPGTQIDTTDPDAWQFPAGTRLWKELTRADVRVETRMLERTEDGAWLAVAYVWDPAAGDAFIQPAGLENAVGTPHDVPSAEQCAGCHGGTRSGVLGISAVQLPDATRQAFAQRGFFTAPPPSIEIPGTDVERGALGWLHANCGHCHNQDRPPRGETRCYDPERDFDLSLRTGELDGLEATGVYRTAIGEIVERGDPDGSRLLQRVSRGVMPPLGHESVDPRGVELLRTWIRGL